MRQKSIWASIVFTTLLSIGCTDDFQNRIDASRALGLNKVPRAEPGLPFFEKIKLNPVWDFENKSSLAKVEGINLTNQDGVSIKDKFFDNRATFVVFFFSSCSVFCSTMIANFKKLSDQLNEFDDVQYLAISVDPKRDTIEKMADYKKKFIKDDNKNWHFAIAEEKQLKHLADKIFSIEIYKDEKNNRIIHSERVFLVDQVGFLRGVFNSTRVDLPKVAKQTLTKIHKKHQILEL